MSSTDSLSATAAATASSTTSPTEDSSAHTTVEESEADSTEHATDVELVQSNVGSCVLGAVVLVQSNMEDTSSVGAGGVNHCSLFDPASGLARSSADAEVSPLQAAKTRGSKEGAACSSSAPQQSGKSSAATAVLFPPGERKAKGGGGEQNCAGEFVIDVPRRTTRPGLDPVGATTPKKAASGPRQPAPQQSGKMGAKNIWGGGKKGNLNFPVVGSEGDGQKNGDWGKGGKGQQQCALQNGFQTPKNIGGPPAMFMGQWSPQSRDLGFKRPENIGGPPVMFMSDSAEGRQQQWSSPQNRGLFNGPPKNIGAPKKSPERHSLRALGGGGRATRGLGPENIGGPPVMCMRQWSPQSRDLGSFKSPENTGGPPQQQVSLKGAAEKNTGGPPVMFMSDSAGGGPQQHSLRGLAGGGRTWGTTTRGMSISSDHTTATPATSADSTPRHQARRVTNHRENHERGGRTRTNHGENQFEEPPRPKNALDTALEADLPEIKLEELATHRHRHDFWLAVELCGGRGLDVQGSHRSLEQVRVLNTMWSWRWRPAPVFFDHHGHQQQECFLKLNIITNMFYSSHVDYSHRRIIFCVQYHVERVDVVISQVDGVVYNMTLRLDPRGPPHGHAGGWEMLAKFAGQDVSEAWHHIHQNDGRKIFLFAGGVTAHTRAPPIDSRRAHIFRARLGSFLPSSVGSSTRFY